MGSLQAILAKTGVKLLKAAKGVVLDKTVNSAKLIIDKVAIVKYKSGELTFGKF